MTNNKIFKPKSKKIFVGEAGRKQVMNPCFELLPGRADNTPKNKISIYEEDFLFIMPAFGLAVDPAGFDEYECYHLTKQQWLNLLEEAQKIVSFAAFDDMFEYVVKQGKHTSYDGLYFLNNNGKSIWNARKEAQIMLEDLSAWTETILKEDDGVEILGL